MTWYNWIGAYVCVWWVALFAVLPLWAKPADPEDPGHAAGAPRRPRLLLKAAITTGVATIIWLVIFAAVRLPIFSIGRS